MSDNLNILNKFDTFISSLISAEPYKLVLSGAVNSSVKYRKITLTIYEKGYLCEQLTDKQAFHMSIPAEKLEEYILSTFPDYSQLNAWSRTFEFSAKRSKKGKLLTNKRACQPSGFPIEISPHDRKKSYLLNEDMVIAPLVDMGVTSASGKIIKSMNDKFRQINRYLEIIDDVIRDNDIKTLNIVDFGCGKSYLTFIVYYYFTEIRHIPINMTGVDLKEDVIDFCNSLADKYGYKNLHFVTGDIALYESETPVDMVISLHACDTATDYALYHAVNWNSRYIFAVPCCQHEVAKQASYSRLPIFEGFGLMKERVSALLTDSIRANMLISLGYRTQLMEFVDLCHTPKNILLRAEKAALPEATKHKALETVRLTCEQFNITPTITELLDK